MTPGDPITTNHPNFCINYNMVAINQKANVACNFTCNCFIKIGGFLKVTGTVKVVMSRR